MTDPEVLRGHVHGFILYRASHAKPPDRPWATNDELQSEHFAANIPTGPTQPSAPLQFELPKPLPQMMMGSYYDKPDPLLAMQAAARLFSPRQLAFASAADSAARHYLGLYDTDGKLPHFTHLHGIGSWESKMEPSMATVFHRPVNPVQLQKIAADVGSWANQEGILTFVPHSGGAEQMIHMRFPSHSPLIKQLDPQTVGNIADRVTGEFNKYYTVSPEGVKNYLIPGRSVLPDTHGHTDVLVWVPWFVDKPDVARTHEAVHQIAHELGGRLQYWTGTGKIVGGMHPYESSNASFTDAQRRRIAQANYHRALSSTSPKTSLHEGDTELPHYEPTEPQKFAMRAPAKVGMVVRGVFYKPGSMIPDLISPGGEKTKMSLEDFKERLKTAHAKKKEPANAHDDSPR